MGVERTNVADSKRKRSQLDAINMGVKGQLGPSCMYEKPRRIIARRGHSSNEYEQGTNKRRGLNLGLLVTV